MRALILASEMPYASPTCGRVTIVVLEALSVSVEFRSRLHAVVGRIAGLCGLAQIELAGLVVKDVHCGAAGQHGHCIVAAGYSHAPQLYGCTQ